MSPMPEFNHLIIIDKPSSDLHIKEWLDIALVSKSYDIKTAVYFDPSVLKEIDEQSSNEQLSPEIKQSFHMLKEFEIDLFSSTTCTCLHIPFKGITLHSLKKQSQHVFILDIPQDNGYKLTT